MAVNVASIVVTATTGIIGWFAFLNVATLCRATLLARDPVPVRPRRRAAGGVPDHDRPAGGAARAGAARRSRRRCKIRYDGQLDVWLLDEGDDPDVKRMCAELGVNHFSRRGVERWNQPTGPHKAKTKHGNYNAWLDAHGERLRLHARRRPRPRAAAELRRAPPRLLPRPRRGVRRRPAGLRQLRRLRRAGAPSRSSSCSTRCSSGPATARARRCSWAPTTPLRLRALRQIGGFQDSITEDMATSLVMHSRAQPGDRRSAGRRSTRPTWWPWGRGPPRSPTTSASRTAGRAAPTRCWRSASGASATGSARARCVHYVLLTCYYPTAAIAWILGAVNAILYFALGAGGVVGARAPVADALRGRGGAAGRALLLQPPAQREPAREEGLGRRRGHADLGAVGADLRGLAGGGGAAPLARVRDHAEGRREHARHA